MDEIRSILKTLYYEIEDETPILKPWKKLTLSLTPDIDTQHFMGDLMQGNSYLTQRIPANWDDPE